MLEPGLQLGNVILVLSHVAVVPALAITLARRFLPEFFVLTAMTLISLLYHFCQTETFCAMSFEILQKSDHIMVYTALTWLILFFTDASMEKRFCGFILVEAALIPLTLNFFDNWWLTGGIIIALTVIALFYMLVIMKKIPDCDWKDLLILIPVTVVGGVLHVVGGSPGSLKYAWTHSFWHVLSMLGIYFLFEAKDSEWWCYKVIDLLRNGIPRKKKEPIKAYVI